MNENTTTVINPSKLGYVDLDTTEVAEELVTYIESIPLTEIIELDLRDCYLDYGPCSKIFDAIFRKLVDSHSPATFKKISVRTHVDLGSSKAMAECLLRSSNEIGAATVSNKEFDRDMLVKYCTEKGIVFEVFPVTYSWVPDDRVTPYVLSAK